MSIYAIGDVQGCLDHLQRLLEKIKFDPKKDKLWFSGDLVNRGPKSLETLQFIKDLGDSALTVLGNHDLHLLAMSAGNMRYLKKDDSLKQVLNAPDCDELTSWLKQQKLIHTDKNLKLSLVHAGIHPSWSIKKANKMARQVEAVLQSKQADNFLRNMYGNRPKTWNKAKKEYDKLRFIVNCFTRMRYVYRNGRLDFQYNSDVGSQPGRLIPWFLHPKSKLKKNKLIFGHWARLSIRQTDNVYAVDTGCLWGGRLSALEINEKETKWHSIDCKKKPA